MTALVIGGASGTIGKAVSLLLKNNGYDVIDASVQQTRLLILPTLILLRIITSRWMS